MNINIATAQYNISFLETWQKYQYKIESWVAEAALQDAKILLFPEYASMELASLFEEDVYSSLARQLDALQTLRLDYIDLFCSLARQYRCYIQAGSFPVRIDSGAYRNRAYLFMPDGHVDYQDKLIMTRFENEQWLIQSGTRIKVFDTDYGKIGINACYDIEFPLLARKQVEAGCNLILAPSCTDTVAGYNRVKIGCQARAMENQCYVVQSSLVGDAPWSDAVDVNIGASAIYTPVDYGFPDDGILATGKFNAVQWVIGEICLADVETVRLEGQVFNHRDWSLQNRFI
jgi:predicted amidohydrolase